MFLFPENPLQPRSVDEHFLPEAQELRWLGEKHTVVSLEELARNVPLEELLRKLPEASADDDKITYRGWMLSPATYASIEDFVKTRGWTMATSATQYQASHEIVGWYEALQTFTPATVWASTAREAVAQARTAHWQAAIVRDYSKSLKHAWAEACYIPAVEKKAAFKVAEKFEELRGDALVGGVVLREFEQFSAVEARTWWVDGNLVAVTPHPDTPGELPSTVQSSVKAKWLPRGFKKELAKLDLGFCTADFAFTAKGKARLVEVGAGSVSDRPRCTDADDFLTAILGRGMLL